MWKNRVEAETPQGTIAVAFLVCALRLVWICPLAVVIRLNSVLGVGLYFIFIKVIHHQAIQSYDLYFVLFCFVSLSDAEISCFVWTFLSLFAFLYLIGMFTQLSQFVSIGRRENIVTFNK